MNLNRLNILLIVHQADRRGIAFQDVAAQAGLKAATVSRQLGTLGKSPLNTHERPLGGVELRGNPEDPRKADVFITRKGKALVSEILALAFPDPPAQAPYSLV